MGGKASGKVVVKKKGISDDFTVTGAAMCLVGGAFLGASTLLSWVIFNSAETDVFGLMERDPLFIVILIADLLGLVQLGMGLLLVRSAAWIRPRKVAWAYSLLAASLISAACMVIGFIQVELTYMQQGSLYSWGPAPFFAIFGVIFGVTGAFLFLIDTKKQPKHQIRKGDEKGKGFVAMKGAPPAHFDSECGSCGTTVTDDMAICPSCGAVLGSKGEVEELEELTEDLDEVK